MQTTVLAPGVTERAARDHHGVFCEPAAAKINLWLKVLGRRADGYHLIDSLVAFVDFGEVVHARPAAANSLRIKGPEARFLLAEGKTAGADNLVLRAAEAFGRVFGGGAFAFTLEKHLPVAAGIGGGSADAAAVLRLLARARGVEMTSPAFRSLALSLGADIPMCLTSSAAHVAGIGEHVTPVRGLDGLNIVAVNPRQQVSTPQVFKALAAPAVSPDATAQNGPSGPGHLAGPDWLAAIRRAKNDLEAPAGAFAPAITRATEVLAAEPGCHVARMSGSGATVFGLFDAMDEAVVAAQNIAVRFPRWWVNSGPLF